MSTLTLIRHGQAQTEARDEVSYDSLSDLGHQQARWLGDHLRESHEHFERVYCGTLNRHVQTATSMGATQYAPIMQDERLNELHYFTLATLIEEQHGIAVPSNREDFAGHFPRLLGLWIDGKIEDAPETFDHFEARVRDGLADIGAGKGPALIVTSGGLIAMAMRQTLGLDVGAMALTGMSIMNTSVHRLHPIGAALAMTQFNAVPHLDQPARHFARTHL